jgi:hypothetical protein
MTFSRRWIRGLTAGTLAAALTACGGGGSGTPTVSVSGTAATGAAIAAGTVTLKCVSGTSEAVTTGVDGNFTIDIGGVTLPCVGRVVYKDATGTAQKLHTFISAAGTANITPITELLVASLTSGTAADAFDNFDAAKNKAFTAAQIKTAADAVKTYLKNTLGVDTTNLPDDPVGNKFLATSASTAGDKADKVLDDVAAKLKAIGKKLGDAVGDIAKGGSSGGTTGAVGSNTFIVTNATVASRNGSYKVSSAAGQLPGGNTNIDYNGNSSDGKFEWDVQYTTAGVIKSAYVWYFEANNAIVTFGCNGGSIPCTGVTYDAASKQVNLANAAFPEIGNAFPGPATLVLGGGSLTVSGAVSVQ